MFAFRKVFGSSKDAPTPPSPRRPVVLTGRLYLVKKFANAKAKRECIFLEAEASIQPVDAPFQYQLVISQLAPDDAADAASLDIEDNEKSFLIDESIQFSLFTTLDEGDDTTPMLAFSWLDISSPRLDARFEFHIRPQSGNSIPDEILHFEKAVYLCMWERVYGRDSSTAPPDELELFKTRLLDNKCRTGEPASPSPPGTPSDGRSVTPGADQSDEDVGEDDGSSSADEIANQLTATSLNSAKSTGSVSLAAADATAAPSVLSPSPPAKPATTPSRNRASLSPSAPSQKSPPTSPPPSLTLQSRKNFQTDAANQPTEGAAQQAWFDHVHLYLFDHTANGFQLQTTSAEVMLFTPTAGSAQKDLCWLTVVSLEKDDPSPLTWVSMNITKDQSLSFRNCSLTFNYFHQLPGTEEPSICTWLLRFLNELGEPDVSRYEAAQEALTKALFERDHGLGSYGKASALERDWNKLKYGLVIEANEDVEMADGTVPEHDESDTEASSSEDDDHDSVPAPRRRSSGPQNSHLAVGYKEDLSFVVRGDMVGVFQNDADRGQRLKFMASIPGITTPDGKHNLMPAKVMLHKQDSTMIVQDRGNSKSLYSLDLTVGKVVEEWKVGERDVSNFFARTKLSQMTPEATLLGNSSNSLFVIDPRLSGSKLATAESKTWASQMNYSCATTTEAGYIALGSRTGEIRLLDSQIGKIAKTSLPGVRDPILALDVTKDGKYMVATCQTYLLFIKCEHQSDGKGTGVLGFQKSFPKDQKPEGKRVELKPEHRALIALERIPICFTPAKFDVGLDLMEKSIVTSIGPYIFSFNVRKLKLGQTDYRVMRYGDGIVAGTFRWDNDRDIVVAMRSDVFLEDRKKLAKPDRHSLVGGSPPGNKTGRKSHAGIVQGWDS